MSKGTQSGYRYWKSLFSFFPVSRSGINLTESKVERFNWTGLVLGFGGSSDFTPEPARILWHGKLQLSPKDVGTNRDTQFWLWSPQGGLIGTSWLS